MKKRFMNKKIFHMFSAIMLSGILFAGHVTPVFAENAEWVYENDRIVMDSVYITEYKMVGDIELPKNDYGTFTWAYPNYIPVENPENCTVILTPAEGKDLSWMKGWDSETRTVTAYIKVYIGEIGVEETEANPSEDTNLPEFGFEENQDEGIYEEIAVGDADENEGQQELEQEAENGANPEISVPDNDENEPGEPTEGTSEEIIPDSEDDKEEIPEEIPEEIIPDSEANKEEISEEITEGIIPDSEDDKEENPEENIPDSEDNKEETPDENTEDIIEDDLTDETLQEEKNPVGETNQDTIFDHEGIQEETRPVYSEEELSDEEKIKIAKENHTCEGIYVYGENLPWYVQFRVYSGEEYVFSNADGADIFQAYEFELWDTINDCEYEIQRGDYVTVRMTVPKGYEYTVEHILKNGAKESIFPLIDGNTLVFSTNSFSPFGIAGSTDIIGDDIIEQNYTTPAPQPTKTPETIPEVSENETEVPEVTEPTENQEQIPENQMDSTKPSTEQQNTTIQKKEQQKDHKEQKNQAVNTGDNSQILLFAGIAGIAFLLIVLVLVYFYIRNKK